MAATRPATVVGRSRPVTVPPGVTWDTWLVPTAQMLPWLSTARTSGADPPGRVTVA